MADKTQANIGFEKQIWDAACVLWGHIPASEYRKVIIGLIFLRYVSSAFERRYQELVEEGDGFEDDRDAYTMDNIFFVPEEARWSTISSAAHTPEIGKVIDNAMRAIEAENKTLKSVLPNNYANPDLDKQVLGDVVDIFTNMDMGDAEESQDLLGRTYEYCIAQFAEKEGKGGGEFYTPSSVVKTLVSILKPFSNCRVYEGIVALPTQLFYSVTIPVTLWFISRNKKQKGKTIFIDARNLGTMVDRVHRDFSDEDIAKISDAFTEFQNGTMEDVKGFCAAATLEDIAKQDYILTPGRYVGIEEQEDDGEPFDEKMTRLTSELADMFAKSHELEDEIRRKLGAIGYEI